MTSVTVVIPAYNEGETFGSRLTSVADYFSVYRSAGYAFEYVVIDDGSADETAACAAAFAAFRPNVHVLTHTKNRGLAAALRAGFAAARGDIVLVLDADLSYSPTVAMELVEALEREDADIVTASPYARGGCVRNVPWLRRTLSREANRLLSLATRGRYFTFTCMVRAYRREALERIAFTSDGMDAVAEIMLNALRARMHVIEIPATLAWSDDRRSSGRTLDVARTIRQIYRTTALAFSYRPTLWLAVPGLVPGLLPIVVAVLLLLHVSPATLAAGTAITIVVQYASLAIFAGQLGAFFGRTFRSYSRHGVHPHGYHTPKRTA